MNLEMKSIKNKYSLNEAECAYFKYKWIADNIVYDCYGAHHNEESYGENATYKNGKGVCTGFSYLFRTMARFLDLEVEYIVGYSKPDSMIPELPSSSNHAWNVVKIDKSYYLVDVTWGSGKCNGDNYVKSFNDYYFCPRPEAFIRRHLPVESKWQLLPNIISYQQFKDMACLSNNFFNNGFLSISPDKTSIDINGKAKINITYDETKGDVDLIIELSYYENSEYKEIPNSVIYYKDKGNIELDIIAYYKTGYFLSIWGGPSELKSLPSIVFMSLENKLEKSKNPTYYPHQYSYGKNVKLIEPLNGNLTKGTFVDFRIKTNVYDNIIIKIGNYFEREFEKLKDGIFYGESVYIFGNDIKITTLKGSTFYYLFSYGTLKNPKMDTEPSFPETNVELPPNVLYSPIFDTLKKGSSYNFKIKCKSVKQMFVLMAIRTLI